MIFTIGFICFVVGHMLHRVGLQTYSANGDRAEIIGALLEIVGMVAIIASVSIWTWHHLP